MGKLLCWMGLHRWKLGNGRMITVGYATVVFADAECERCRKQDTKML